MTATWKANREGNECVAVRTAQDPDALCGILTFGYTTIAEAEAPDYHAAETAARTAMEELQQAAEVLFAQVPVMPPLDAVTAYLERIDQKLIVFGQVIAQGVYAGGAFFYQAADAFLCIPFGGAYVYIWDEKTETLRHAAGGPGEHRLIRDALGAHGCKEIRPITGRIYPGMAVYVCGSEIGNLADCQTQMKTLSAESALQLLVERQTVPERCGTILQIVN